MIESLKTFDIPLRGIIHIGAHEGQEYEEYLQSGITKMMFFEPIEKNFMSLVRNVPIGGDIHAYCMALGNESGQKNMFVETENKGMSCSVLEPKKHLDQYPWIEFKTKEVVKIELLDNIWFHRKDYNILNIDVQGFELEVLKGSERTLKFIDAIFTEVNRVEMYKDCALIDDIDSFLAFHCFKRVTPDIIDNWGDALYIKNKYLK